MKDPASDAARHFAAIAEALGSAEGVSLGSGTKKGFGSAACRSPARSSRSSPPATSWC
jgi:hypothetical protein